MPSPCAPSRSVESRMEIFFAFFVAMRVIMQIKTFVVNASAKATAYKKAAVHARRLPQGQTLQSTGIQEIRRKVAISKRLINLDVYHLD